MAAVVFGVHGGHRRSPSEPVCGCMGNGINSGPAGACCVGFTSRTAEDGGKDGQQRLAVPMTCQVSFWEFEAAVGSADTSWGGDMSGCVLRHPQATG